MTTPSRARSWKVASVSVSWRSRRVDRIAVRRSSAGKGTNCDWSEKLSATSMRSSLIWRWRGEKGVKLGRQHRNVIYGSCPQYLIFDLEVHMHQKVSCTNDLPPWDFWMRRPE